MIDFAIVGAGISGLSTAWFLRQQGFSVCVVEAADRVGGTIRSFREEGFLIEGGPNSTLENTDALGELIRGVGLAGDLQAANPEANRRYILKQGGLVQMPGNALEFLRTPLFSVRGKLRLLAEPFIGRAPAEESIADFVRRRLGQEFLDWAIDPFISGVYAGDPEQLSVRFATRKIHGLEAQYRSLFVGALVRLVGGGRSGPAPSGRMISFTSGMQAFPQAVARSLGDAVRVGEGVAALKYEGEGWDLMLTGGAGSIAARWVVLALPAYRAADLLKPISAPLAEALNAIQYPPVASVALGFERHQVGHPLDGFGFLIPGREGKKTLGTLFSSTLFPGRAPQDHVLLTSFIGGARNPRVAEMDEAELVAQVLEEIRPILGIQGDPMLVRVQLWRHAIPQYRLGYGELLERIRRLLGAQEGLYARTNWLDGISLSDCVRNGREFARAMSQAGPPAAE
jgi:oxygen-dependent protoporphyrinogen oxidase